MRSRYASFESILKMRRITAKQLHEQTETVLNQVKRGERFIVTREGTAAALIVAASDPMCQA
jgi:antitoxin (DNA-binding transcriptional repressor) of toxin-antitoxin stability system